MRQGLNHIQRLMSKYPADDVRYVPTIDEQLERLKNVSLDQVRTIVYRLPRCGPTVKSWLSAISSHRRFYLFWQRRLTAGNRTNRMRGSSGLTARY